MNPLDIQIGGNHYKNFKIQPIEYVHANNLGYCESNVIKYISRWKFKNGIEDLKKAKHYIELLIKLEELENDRKKPVCNPEKGLSPQEINKGLGRSPYSGLPLDGWRWIIQGKE